MKAGEAKRLKELELENGKPSTNDLYRPGSLDPTMAG